MTVMSSQAHAHVIPMPLPQPTPCDDRRYDRQKIGTKKYPAVKRGIVEGFCNAVTFVDIAYQNQDEKQYVNAIANG